MSNKNVSLFSGKYLFFLSISSLILGIIIELLYTNHLDEELVYLQFFFFGLLIAAEIFRRKDRNIRLIKFGKEFQKPSWKMNTALVLVITMLVNIGFILAYDITHDVRINKELMPMNYIFGTIVILLYQWEIRNRKENVKGKKKH